jgi:hypothetical protein
VRFEPWIPELERAKTVHASDRAAITATTLPFLKERPHWATQFQRKILLLLTRHIYQNWYVGSHVFTTLVIKNTFLSAVMPGSLADV